MPVLKSLLDELALIGQAQFIEQEEKTKPASGKDSEVFFLQSKQLADTPVKLAFSRSHHLKPAAAQSVDDQLFFHTGSSTPSSVPPEMLEKAKKAFHYANFVQNIFLERGVDTSFLQTFFAFNAFGQRVSPHASEKSLYDYIDAHLHQLTREQIKNIFGQILLGVNALHEKNLVHRDLHYHNILVTKIGNELFATVSDPDELVSVSSIDSTVNQAHFYIYAGPVRPPELNQFVKIKDDNEYSVQSKENNILYKKINLKACDCYSIGMILEKLISQAAPGEIGPDDSLRDLCSQLCADAPENRLSVEKAMQHAVFNNPIDKQFFENLQKRPAPDEYLGAYRARAFKIDDAFVLMHEPLKDFYQAGRRLDDVFNYFDATITRTPLDNKDEDKNLVGKTLEEKTLYDYFNAFETEAEKLLASNLINETERKKIEQLRNTARGKKEVILRKELAIQAILADAASIQLLGKPRDFFDFAESLSDNQLREIFLEEKRYPYLASTWQQLTLNQKIVLVGGLDHSRAQEILTTTRQHNDFSGVMDSLDNTILESKLTCDISPAKLDLFKNKVSQALLIELAFRTEIAIKEPTNFDNLRNYQLLSEEIAKHSKPLAAASKSQLEMFIQRLNIKQLPAVLENDYSILLLWPRFSNQEKTFIASHLTHDALQKILSAQRNKDSEYNAAMQILFESVDSNNKAVKIYITSEYLNNFVLDKKSWGPVLELAYRTAIGIDQPANLKNLVQYKLLLKDIPVDLSNNCHKQFTAFIKRLGSHLNIIIQDRNNDVDLAQLWPDFSLHVKIQMISTFNYSRANKILAQQEFDSESSALIKLIREEKEIQSTETDFLSALEMQPKDSRLIQILYRTHIAIKNPIDFDNLMQYKILMGEIEDPTLKNICEAQLKGFFSRINNHDLKNFIENNKNDYSLIKLWQYFTEQQKIILVSNLNHDRIKPILSEQKDYDSVLAKLQQSGGDGLIKEIIHAISSAEANITLLTEFIYRFMISNNDPTHLGNLAQYELLLKEMPATESKFLLLCNRHLRQNINQFTPETILLFLKNQNNDRALAILWKYLSSTQKNILLDHLNYERLSAILAVQDDKQRDLFEATQSLNNALSENKNQMIANHITSQLIEAHVDEVDIALLTELAHRTAHGIAHPTDFYNLVNFLLLTKQIYKQSLLGVQCDKQLDNFLHTLNADQLELLIKQLEKNEEQCSLLWPHLTEPQKISLLYRLNHDNLKFVFRSQADREIEFKNAIDLLKKTISEGNATSEGIILQTILSLSPEQIEKNRVFLTEFIYRVALGMKHPINLNNVIVLFSLENKIPQDLLALKQFFEPLKQKYINNLTIGDLDRILLLYRASHRLNDFWPYFSDPQKDHLLANLTKLDNKQLACFLLLENADTRLTQFWPHFSPEQKKYLAGQLTQDRLATILTHQNNKVAELNAAVTVLESETSQAENGLTKTSATEVLTQVKKKQAKASAEVSVLLTSAAYRTAVGVKEPTNAKNLQALTEVTAQMAPRSGCRKIVAGLMMFTGACFIAAAVTAIVLTGGLSSPISVPLGLLGSQLVVAGGIALGVGLGLKSVHAWMRPPYFTTKTKVEKFTQSVTNDLHPPNDKKKAKKSHT